MLNCLAHGINTGDSYPESVRKFCLSIHFHSPVAYNVLRENFNKNLPHPHTISAWYRHSDLRSDPGLQAETLERLKSIATEIISKTNTPLICCLVADEVYIRKQVLWSNQSQRYYGYISYGMKPGETEETRETLLPIANQALVFMLSGINYKFEFPVAYHFINSLDSSDKTALFLEITSKITECGIIIKSVVFDGLKSNFGMCRKLGANLDIFHKDFKPHFENPINGSKIYIIFDNCHMEKLVRNTLGNKGVIYDDNGERIEWKHFIDLEIFSREHDLRTHKLNKKHIDFKSSIMNVKVASETISNSVADSFQFLLNKGVENFTKVAPTIRFVQIFNNIFDVFNSHSGRSTQPFKRPLNADNRDKIYDLFTEATAYIKKLKIDANVKNKSKKILLTNSANSTAFKGYVINMSSLKSMYSELVEEEKLMNSFCTYALSQDHIEIFFGKIRSFHGHNNNPDVINFQSAYRKLCANVQVMAPEKSNCQQLQMQLSSLSWQSDIYFVSSRRPKMIKNTLEDVEFMRDVHAEREKIYSDISTLEEMDRTYYLTDGYAGASIAYIARLIEEKIENCFFCEQCKFIFEENEQLVDCFKSSTTSKRPCKSSYNICCVTDKFLRTHQWNDGSQFRVKYFLIFQEINFDKLYENSSFDQHEAHKFHLVKSIINEYCRIRGNQLSRKITTDMMSEILRKRLNKWILSSGQ